MKSKNHKNAGAKKDLLGKKVSKSKTTTLPVHGMTCSACKNKIELNLEKISGIQKVSADVKSNSVKIVHSDELDLKKAKATIKELGYSTKKISGAQQGLLYGLIPHAGCIAFIIASIIGASFFMNLFRPLLMSSYFFYALIVISILFATLSAIIYLKNNGLLSREGIKRQKKYLVTLYGTTIIINLALFLLIFPLTANLASARTSTANEYSQTLELEVVIPCSGHAPLIISELNQEVGVQDVRYTFPYKFVVWYDAEVTSPSQILDASIFTEFPAKYDETETKSFSGVQNLAQQTQVFSGSCGGSCGGSCAGSCEGACGGACGATCGDTCGGQGFCNVNS